MKITGIPGQSERMRGTLYYVMQLDMLLTDFASGRGSPKELDHALQFAERLTTGIRELIEQEKAR